MTFRIGGRVRLTGLCWNSHPGVSVGDIVTLSGRERNGDFYFFTDEGAKLYVQDYGIYKVERVTDEWIPAFTEVEQTVKVKKVVEKPDVVPGDVLVVKTATGELVTYFASAESTPYLYNSSDGYAKWDTILESAESYRFLFKDGKVV